MSKKALVPVAEGTEELEAVTIIDILRRAGADVTVASVGELQVRASRGVTLVADTTIGECAGREKYLKSLNSTHYLGNTILLLCLAACRVRNISVTAAN